MAGRFFRRLRHNLRNAVAISSVAALLNACDRPANRADLVFLNGAEPESIDPAVITGQLDSRIVYALFEGLTIFGENGPQPGIAETWEISPDGKTYTFHLRSNANWSNGRPVIAKDFVDSWQRTLSPEQAAEYAYQLYYLKNAKAFNEGTLKDFSQVGVKALDDRTLVVTLENPTPFFLDLCWFATLLPVSVETVKKYGEEWIKPKNIVTNGAFLLEEWRLNDRIRLRKNPNYWNAANVRLNSVDVLPIENSMTAYNFYASGVADLIMDKGLTPPALIADLKRRPDFHAAPFLGNYFIRFNVTRPPFNDVRVRQAFSLVIDKDLIVNKITRAGEIPATSFVPPKTAGYEPPASYARDPEKARRLLAEAGYPGGKGFPPINYLYDDKKINENIAVELQAMFQRELGIRMGLQRQEWKVYLNTQNRLDYDLCRSSWVGDYNDPNTFMDMFVTDGGNNRTGWSNPQYDQWIAEAAAELDSAKRYAIFQKAERMLVTDEAPICPLYYYVGIQIYDSKKLGGIQANVLDEHPLRAIYRK
ncbi:MAG TPA: peptide ABC transporter substrate-binding protein [Chthoniobacterales bacterium]